MTGTQNPEAPKPENAEHYKKAINLGKELTKRPELTKADVARQMYEYIRNEKREVIAQAFIEGAALTPKGAMTYFYNVRRWHSRNKEK